MLFNSLIYLFAFLPIVSLGFYIIGLANHRWIVNLWLLAASFIFYAYWLPEYLPILLSSIGVNYIISRLMFNTSARGLRKGFLVFGILFNIGILGYFKYADFILTNASFLLRVENPSLLNLALPLGISFFTFQQIAFLVDRYNDKKRPYNLLNFGLFVSFFPQLIAGPIVHHKEMMPQFRGDKKRTPIGTTYMPAYF